jgi:hypothetical protein
MRIRTSSFARAPLDKELFIKHFEIKYLTHIANKCFYGTQSIKMGNRKFEREVQKLTQRERPK